MRYGAYIGDIKCEIAPVLAPAWQALGIPVLYCNPTGKHADLCPHTNFNPLEAPIDCYWSEDPNLYRNTTSFFRGNLGITNPPPPPGAQNEYFTNGGRGCGSAIGLSQIINQPEKATYPQIYRIASDSEEAMGVLRKGAERPESDTDTVANDLRRTARAMLNLVEGKNAHHFADFLAHVKDPLAAFDETGWLSDAGEFAAARFSDIRKKRMVIVNMTPLANLADYSVYNSLMANALFLACKMQPTGRPVRCILDEFTSLRIPNFEREMLTLRGLGCSADLYIQERSDLSQQMGENAARTIYGQCDIRQFMAIDSEAQEVSERVLGAENVKEYDASFENKFEDVRFSLKDTAVPLRSQQALQAMGLEEQIIKIRSMRPIPANKIAYWNIGGFEILGENPLEGAAPKVNPKARLNITPDGVEVISPKPPTHFASPEQKGPKVQHLVTFKSFLWLYAWLGISVLFTMADSAFIWPAVRWQYSYSGTRENPIYHSCDYITLNGQSFTTYGHCPLIMLD